MDFKPPSLILVTYIPYIHSLPYSQEFAIFQIASDLSLFGDHAFSSSSIHTSIPYCSTASDGMENKKIRIQNGIFAKFQNLDYKYAQFL